MNSFKALHDALAYEIVRQAELIESGGTIVQETRHWDVGRQAHELAAQQGRGARLPLLPRARHGAVRVLGRVHRRHPRAAARASRRDARALHEPSTGCRRTTRRCSRATSTLAVFFESAVAIAGAGAREGDQQRDANDLSAYLNAEGIELDGVARACRMVAELVALVEERHDLGQAGQGRLRRDGRDRRRARRDRRAQGHEAGLATRARSRRSSTGSSRPTPRRSRGTAAARPGSSASSWVRSCARWAARPTRRS